MGPVTIKQYIYVTFCPELEALCAGVMMMEPKKTHKFVYKVYLSLKVYI